MGITYFKRYRMHYDLRRRLPEWPSIDARYEFLPWNDKLVRAHSLAKYHSFRHELDANVFPCLAEKDGCESLMREISSRRGFVPEATWLVQDLGNSEFCGTVQGINDKELIGSIQNLGVTPPHRGNGIGNGLLIRALAGFRSIGMETASLEVTARNEDAVRLYERFGFTIFRTVYKSIEIVGNHG